MPFILFTLIILIAALGGYLIAFLFTSILFRPYSPTKIAGFKLQGILPALIPVLAKQASARLETEWLSADKIAEKLDDPALMPQLKPEIEKHVEEFLKVRLKEAFPLLSNFMGEKTLGKFKDAFLNEVETILPMLLKSYSGKMIEQWEPAKVLAQKINNTDPGTLEKTIRAHTAKQIMAFQLLGAALGAVIGLVQVLLISLY